MTKTKYLAAVLIGIAGLGLQQAKADTYDFNLSSPNNAISGYTGPYVAVHIDLNDEITRDTVVAHGGEVVNPKVQALLGVNA